LRTLEVRGLTKSFGGIKAVSNLSFYADEGYVKAIIGPNGAGKTTVFNLISGLIAPDGGEIFFSGKKINSLKPYERARIGIGRTFQKSFVFEELTVFENVLVIAENVKSKMWDRFLKPEEISENALKLVGLDCKANEPAGTLSTGERHLLEIARALALKPKVMLLDEPAAGLNDAETEKLEQVLVNLKEQGMCIILVEHDMKFVMRASDEVLVMHRGEKLAEGPPMMIQEDDRVIEAYLGSRIHHD
jgi:branched-chain amino acid transport system ATP-binding protein